MRGSIALATLLAAAALAAGDVVKVAAPAKAEWVTVPADPVLTELRCDKAATWILVDDGPEADLRASADGKSATFAAATGGQFRVLAIAGADVHRMKLVKGPPQPMPPGPDHPDPPRPPPPADPLVAKLQWAYSIDRRPDGEKTADRLLLVELYHQAADLASDPGVLTTGDLVARVQKARETLKVVGLVDVRKAIAGEIGGVFPTDETLTAESRKKAADLFTKIKLALEAVK